MSKLQWTASFVEPGRTYPDEPTVEIGSGWYVFGVDPAKDPECGADVVVRVEHAVNDDGVLIDEEIAKRIAVALSGVSS